MKSRHRIARDTSKCRRRFEAQVVTNTIETVEIL